MSVYLRTTYSLSLGLHHGSIGCLSIVMYVHAFFTPFAAFGVDESSTLYHCPHAPDSEGLVYTPNIPDYYFDDQNAANFRNGYLTETGNKGTTYVFTIPPESTERNCSGTVMAIQFCYQARARDIGRTRNVFDFIILTRNGQELTVTERRKVKVVPSDTTCTNPPGSIERVCCTMQKFTEQFELPSSNFTFGVVNRMNRVRMLTFVDIVTEFDVERFHIRQHGNAGPIPGDVLSPGSKFVRHLDRSLLLLRFLIGELSLLWYAAHTLDILLDPSKLHN